MYLPEGRWTSLLTGETADGGGWVREQHAVDSLPLYVRGGTVLPLGARVDRPDYAWADGVSLHAFELADGAEVSVRVPSVADDGDAWFTVRREGSRVVATSDSPPPWRLVLGVAGPAADAADGLAEVTLA